MSEAELIGIIRDANAQYAVLFGQIMTINFAMIVAIYYFLHRAPLLFRAAAFGFYGIGMLSLNGLMLEQGNYKLEALAALANLPPGHRSQMADSVLDLNRSWLSHWTSFFLSVGIWILFLATHTCYSCGAAIRPDATRPSVRLGGNCPRQPWVESRHC